MSRPFATWSRLWSKDAPRRKTDAEERPVPWRIDAVSRPDAELIETLSRPDAKPWQRLRACAELIRFGQIGMVVPHLVDLMEISALKPRVEELLEQCQKLRALDLETPEARNRPAQEDGPGEVGFWSAPADSRTTVVAFAGKGKRLGVSMYFMRSLLQQHDVNVIFLFDWKDACFLGGVSGLGESVEETAAGIRRLCAEMGTRRLICLGQSLGGYAAIRYGAELGADAVMAFSPVILPVLEGEIFERIRAATHDDLTPADVDLRPLLGGRKRTPLTWIIFGEESLVDLQSAEYLAGLPRVIPYPVPGIDKHTVLTPLALSGEFSPLFARLSAEIGRGRWRATPPKR